ncbi:hypothetical protein D3C84_328100 [compost metagenome]
MSEVTGQQSIDDRHPQALGDKAAGGADRMHFDAHLRCQVDGAKHLIELGAQGPLPAQQYQRHIAQMLHVDHCMAGQRMIRGHDADTFGFQYRFNVEVGQFRRQTHEAEIGRPVEHGALDGVVRAGEQLDDDVLVTLEKFGNDFRQQLLGHAGRHAHLEQALVRATDAQLIGHALNALHSIHQPRDLGEQLFGFRRGHQTALFTQEQGEAQCFFQLCQQAAYGRLG